MRSTSRQFSIRVYDSNGELLASISGLKGEILRQVLISNHLSPHAKATSRLNCFGNGICATCGVFIKQEVTAQHWHDKLAKRFCYPRLSCQVKIDADLDIMIPKKLVWGKPDQDAFEQG